MADIKQIPIFPLNIIPLPGELVPLHIFEPRYRQLLEDIEASGQEFGIQYRHPLNSKRVGSLVKLENVIKRYESGESDILVKGTGAYVLDTFHSTLKTKLYPGGEVYVKNSTAQQEVNGELKVAFEEYAGLVDIDLKDVDYNIHDIANQIDLDTKDRIKYLEFQFTNKLSPFILQRLNYKKFVIQQEIKSKDIYFLN